MNETLLNMIPSSYIPEVHLSQYDVGRTIPFKLMDGNSEYTVPSGANIKILATKPSGLGFEVACTFSGNIVTLVNTETMSNESGRFRAELRITSGNVILGTSNFIMNVERSPHPEGTIDGDAETLLPELTLLVERIEDSNARIESMTASATPLPSGQNPTASYNPTTNTLELGIPVADRQYITVDGVNYPITSITKTVVDEVSGLLVAYGTDSTVFIPDGVGVKNVAQILQAQINGKVSAVKLNGDILTPHYDSAFGDGVVDLGTISDDTKADAIVKSASGSIASFSDGGDEMPMKSLKVNIVPKQSGSGDPSPSNIRSISGTDTVVTKMAGKNYNEPLYNVEISPEGVESAYAYSVSTDYFPVEGGDTVVYWPYNDSEGYRNQRFSYFDASKKFISQTARVISPKTKELLTDTAPSGAKYCRLTNEGAYTSSTHIYLATVLKSTITTNLPQTVYAGIVDVANGKISLTHAVVDMSTLSWRTVGNVFVADCPNGFKQTGDYPITGSGDGWCSIFNVVKMGHDQVPNDSMLINARYMADTQSNAVVWASEYTTLDAFLSAVAGQTLVYKLATPIEITLTPTEAKSLLGANNVWSESGTVEVEYRADTTLAYNELLNLIANM